MHNLVAAGQAEQDYKTTSKQLTNQNRKSDGLLEVSGFDFSIFRHDFYGCLFENRTRQCLESSPLVYMGMKK